MLRHLAEYVDAGITVYHKSWACEVTVFPYVDIVAEDLAQMQKLRRYAIKCCSMTDTV